MLPVSTDADAAGRLHSARAAGGRIGLGGVLRDRTEGRCAAGERIGLGGVLRDRTEVTEL